MDVGNETFSLSCSYSRIISVKKGPLVELTDQTGRQDSSFDSCFPEHLVSIEFDVLVLVYQHNRAHGRIGDA